MPQPRWSAALFALLAFVGSATAQDNLSLAKPYADSIWDALLKLGDVMAYTRTALQVANLDDDVQKPELQRTFFAMDNEAWLDLARHYTYPTVDSMLLDVGLTTNILLNHMLVEPHTTAFWPPFPKPGVAVDTELTGQVPGGGPNVLHLRTDQNGDYEIVGYVLVGELSPVANRTNLLAGKSIVHVIHDVDAINAVY